MQEQINKLKALVSEIKKVSGKYDSDNDIYSADVKFQGVEYSIAYTFFGDPKDVEMLFEDVAPRLVRKLEKLTGCTEAMVCEALDGLLKLDALNAAK